MTSFEEVLARKTAIHDWLARRVSAEATAWLEGAIAKYAASGRYGDLAMAIGLAPRKLGKAELALSDDEVRTGQELRRGLDTSDWSIDQAGRVLIVLASYMGDDQKFAATLDRLFQAGEIGEHIAILRGLPLYPAPELLIPRAAEGVRSAIQPVFEAVTHRNPFPKDHFDQAQWNQMVLKALFIGSKLAPIQGLDERRNPELAATLMDYVHERWAAGRAVSPELWRCVGPFTRREDLPDLVKALRGGEDAQSAAAALALSESMLPEAQEALAVDTQLTARIKAKNITWNSIHF
ncbi:EboA domain-containing protein [Hyphomicrobium sp.]|uniref:EboA domain-containing protein n=1 Tax=Hyphomicrobium sp. TaxID=82 RepID=UPI000FA88448|nr:EboA domain-containing protein [Hyphomicrobium sp.]RUP09193.1 MAG: hypothetical protein EKK38_11220 [Hyphomicrobium sp.]